jgi:hypothetical protein
MHTFVARLNRLCQICIRQVACPHCSLYLQSLSHNIHTSAHICRSLQSFVSTSDRWRAHTAPPTAPEVPGNYDMSKSVRPVKGDPTALGPGKYAIPDPWVKKVRACVDFYLLYVCVHACVCVVNV